MPDPDDVVYRINDRDEIVFVNDAWDRFAAANAGEAMRSAAVLGRRVWDFIADPTTREIYRHLLQRTREGRLFRFTIRCDSPARRRLLQLDLHEIGGGSVEFHTRVLSEQPRPSTTRPATAAADPVQLLSVCGWCKKACVGGSWLEIEDALPRLRPFAQPLPPKMSHGICDECFRKMTGLPDGS